MENLTTMMLEALVSTSLVLLEGSAETREREVKVARGKWSLSWEVGNGWKELGKGKTCSVTLKNLGIRVSSVRLHREVPGVFKTFLFVFKNCPEVTMKAQALLDLIFVYLRCNHLADTFKGLERESVSAEWGEASREEHREAF